MNKLQTIYIEYGTKKYPLVITYTGKIHPKNGELVHVRCDAIELDQEYAREDLPILISELPEMIETELADRKEERINIRIDTTKRNIIDTNARKFGYKNRSEYMTSIAVNPVGEVERFLEASH